MDRNPHENPRLAPVGSRPNKKNADLFESKRSHVVGLSLVGLLPAAALAATLQTDNFQQGSNEGWAGNMFGPPTVQTTGGPAGPDDAFLLAVSSGDTGPGSHLAVYNSGAAWQGDYAAVGAESVLVDLMNPVESAPLEVRVVLFGPSLLSERWTSTNPAMVPNDGLWRSFEFPLAEDALTRVDGTASYADLISSVLRLMLRHDAGPGSAGGTPIAASLGIDNVRLAGAAATPGDFDGDGDADGSDLVAWQRGESAAPHSSVDLAQWQAAFANAAASTASAPEPPTSILVSLAMLTLANRRKRQAGCGHLRPCDVRATPTSP